MVEGAEGIGEILEDAEGLIISGAGFAGLTGNYCETVLRNAPACTSVAICVEAGKNADAMEAARKARADRQIPCSVLRVHELRGGGPGTNKGARSVEHEMGRVRRDGVFMGEELEDLGLSRQFYDTQFDFPKFQADEYADKFLLRHAIRLPQVLGGRVRVISSCCARCRFLRMRRPRRASIASSSNAVDAVSHAGPGRRQARELLPKMKAANGIQRDDGVTNRAVVGRALVAALTCEPVDLTMNVEEGLRPVLVGRTGRRGSRRQGQVSGELGGTGTRPPSSSWDGARVELERRLVTRSPGLGRRHGRVGAHSSIADVLRRRPSCVGGTASSVGGGGRRVSSAGAEAGSVAMGGAGAAAARRRRGLVERRHRRVQIILRYRWRPHHGHRPVALLGVHQVHHSLALLRL